MFRNINKVMAIFYRIEIVSSSWSGLYCKSVWPKKRLSRAYVIPLRELREKEKFSKFKFKCETHNLGWNFLMASLMDSIAVLLVH